MGYRYRVDPVRGIVEEWIEGEVTVDEILAGYAELVEHPEFRSDLAVLTDMSKSGLDCSFEEVERLVDESPDGLLSTGRWAIHAPVDLQYGIARMLETVAMRREWNVRVFRNADEAKAWLDGKG